MAVINKRKSSKGDNRWQVIIRKKGYKTICKTFSSLTSAKHFAKTVETEMERGTFQLSNHSKRSAIITVANLIDEFAEKIAPIKYKHPEKYYVIYNYWKNRIGNVLISELNANTLSECKFELMNSAPLKKYKGHTVKSASTVNKYLFCLSAILKYAVNELEIIPTNPMKKVEKLTLDNMRERFLSKEEIPLLLNACKNKYYKLYVFVSIALATGARYSEISKLDIKKSVDLANKMFYFYDTKNSENRGVPITNNIYDMIKNYIADYDITEYLFKNEHGQFIYFKGMFEKVVEEIHLKDFRFHDIRHTTASYLAMNGASALDIATILGHKTMTMVKRYSHLTTKHTAGLLNNVQDVLLN